MKQDIVAQVHKQTKSTTSSDNDYANSEDNLDVPKSDKNENYSGKFYVFTEKPEQGVAVK